MTRRKEQAREWISLALSTRKGLAVLLVLLWATEIFLVQEATLREHHYYAGYQPILHRGVRAALDVLACTMLVTLLPRFLVALCVGGGLIFFGVVLSFENYSGHPLSATMITSTAGEGASVANAGFAMLPSWMLLLVATMMIKFVILHRMRHFPSLPTRHRWSRVARLAVSYLLIVIVLNIYKPFTLLLGWESVGGIGSVYGYTPTWVAELLLLDPEQILERALVRADTQSDRLGSGIEAELPRSDRLVFLQVESLDAAVLAHDVEGRPVTAELRRLSEASMSYLIRSEKRTGSCDADFTAIMGGLPSVDMPNYKIQGFPYEQSFVRDLQSWGYTTTAVHNVKGAFFNRRDAFNKIAFDRMFFLEELRRDEGLPFESWAVLDHDMLNWAARDLSSAEGKQFSLIITATSHIPFRYTPAEHRELFKDNNDIVPSYLDSMHYVDQAIGAYVAKLPKGTLLVIYGDHGAFVGSQKHGYENLEYGDVALVPFLIHQVGSDLSTLQKTRDTELATSGELTLLDMMTYVHRETRRHNEQRGTRESP